MARFRPESTRPRNAQAARFHDDDHGYPVACQQPVRRLPRRPSPAKAAGLPPFTTTAALAPLAAAAVALGVSESGGRIFVVPQLPDRIDGALQ
tara:strand:- start:1581 stop:1859 length:279 start_codon:yes stop_codon:yes gene_type:complete